MKEPDLRRFLRELDIQVTGKTHTGWLTAGCPFAQWTHSHGTDRRPSFGVKVEPGGISAYQCHTCKLHGRVSSLARALGHYRHEDRNHYAALATEMDDVERRDLAFEWGDRIVKDENAQEPIVESIYENMFSPVDFPSEASEYLERRGISEDTAKDMGLRWDPRQRRVVFTVRDQAGKCYGYTGRAIDDETQPKIRDYAGLKKRQHVLGRERWRREPGRPLIVVEGLFAFAHLVHMGVERVADVGALLGSEMTDWKARVIREHDAPVLLLLDDDEAGLDGTYGKRDREGNRDWRTGAVAKLVDGIPVWVATWPPGKDDPDQLTKAEVWDMLRGMRSGEKFEECTTFDLSRA